MKKSILLGVILLMIMTSCVVVNQGEIGIKRRFGKIAPHSLSAGLYGFNPFTSIIIVTPIRTVNIEVSTALPSKEGLTIRTEISILYSVRPEAVPKIIEEIGTDFERTVIIPVFRSASADVSANFMAKDMHSGRRYEIEERIKIRMDEVLSDRGFVIEQVLLKSIELPAELSRAIERKLRAEQESQEMEFILQRESQEADRRRIEAEGTRDAQKILSEGLNREIIELRSIEAFRELSKSPNSKIIIVDGSTPFLINSNEK
ncbi:MAG: prohibitin family protein [Cyclobacteriaceae bacterium]